MLLGSDTVLEVERVSKLYSRAQSNTRQRLARTFWNTLTYQSMLPVQALNPGEFWSLKDISFSLKRGEALGVIGFNGAGKTTLLRVLSGQLLPDEGEIRMIGKTAAMIDLTAGFQMGASGTRNIYLRGAMLGRSRQQMESSYQEIIEFAELGDAIDAPVATYSSGMLMRLAFSIMVSMEPDILFIDEILAVGDFRFRQKCLARIRELRDYAAFVLVSHSMDDISRFCNRTLVLEKGIVVFDGTPEDAIEYYSKQMTGPQESHKERTIKKVVGDFHIDHNIIEDVVHFWCDHQGSPISRANFGEDLFFTCRFSLKKEVHHLTLGLPIWTDEGQYVTGFASKTQAPITLPSRKGHNEYLLKVPKLAINPGTYLSNIVVRDGPGYLYRQPNKALFVESDLNWHFGAVTLKHTWQTISLEINGKTKT